MRGSMDKEVRFTEKKVDQSWKEDVAREKRGPAPGPIREEAPAGRQSPLSFSAFLTSLGYQTLMHLGEVPHPETQERHLDLDAARETIDLLIMLESKTKGNLTQEEEKLLKGLLQELQMKFVAKAQGA